MPRFSPISAEYLKKFTNKTQQVLIIQQ